MDPWALVALVGLVGLALGGVWYVGRSSGATASEADRLATEREREAAAYDAEHRWQREQQERRYAADRAAAAARALGAGRADRDRLSGLLRGRPPGRAADEADEAPSGSA